MHQHKNLCVIVRDYGQLMVALNQGIDIVLGVPEESGAVFGEMTQDQEEIFRQALTETRTKILSLHLSEVAGRQVEEIIGSNVSIISHELNRFGIFYCPMSQFLYSTGTWHKWYENAVRMEERPEKIA